MRYDGRDDYEEYYDDYDAYEEYEEPQPYFLTARDLIFFCLAFMTPTAATVLYGTAQPAAHGTLSGSYIVALVIALLTILSYRRLGRAFPEGGSVLTYVGYGIHFRAGYYAGWTALFFYIVAASSFFMIGADAAAALFDPIPRIFWLILIAAVSGIVVIFGQRLSALALTVIVLGVIGITAIYILVCFMSADKLADANAAAATAAADATGGEGGSFGLGPLMSGAALACLAFLGFDSVTTLSIDAANPKRDTGKAMAVACLCAAALFFFQAMASSAIIPDYTQLDPQSAVSGIALMAGGPTLHNMVSLATILSAFGVGIAATTAGSRMLRILREEFSPSGGEGAHGADGGSISSIFPQTGTSPINVVACLAAALVIALIMPEGASGLAFDLARFAGMICFMTVNASALIFFWFKRHDHVYVRSIIIPAAGFLFSLWSWINIDPSAFGIGVIFALVGVIIVAASFLYERLVLGIGPAPDKGGQ
jgi:putrescine importer